MFWKEDDGARSVIFLKRIISKAPITNLTVVGDQLLKHGQLVSSITNLTFVGDQLLKHGQLVH